MEMSWFNWPLREIRLTVCTCEQQLTGTTNDITYFSLQISVRCNCYERCRVTNLGIKSKWINLRTSPNVVNQHYYINISHQLQKTQTVEFFALMFAFSWKILVTKVTTYYPLRPMAVTLCLEPVAIYERFM